MPIWEDESRVEYLEGGAVTDREMASEKNTDLRTKNLHHGFNTVLTLPRWSQVDEDLFQRSTH